MSAAGQRSVPFHACFHGCLGILLAVCLAASPAGATLAWQTDIATACQLAADTHKLVLLHFWDEACPPCRRLEAQVFSQPAFSHEVDKLFVPVRIHASNSPDLARRYQVTSWPTDIILTPEGTTLYRGTSPQDGQLYLRNLGQIAWRHQSGMGQHDFAYGPPRFVGQAAGATAAFAQADLGTAGPGTEPEHQLMGNYEHSPWSSGPQWPQQPQAAHPSGLPEGPPAAAAPAAAAHTSLPGPPTAVRDPSGGQLPGVSYGPHLGQPLMIRNQYVGPPPATSDAPSPEAGARHGVTTAAADHHTAALPTAMNSSSSAPPAKEQVSAGALTHEEPSRERLTPALDGHCCLALVEENRWVPGDPRWGVHHRGRLYLFSTAAAQQRFLADADRFSPALAGYDPVIYRDAGLLVPGHRAHGLWYEGRIYLFANEDQLAKFELSPADYAEAARAALAAVDTQR